MCLTAATPHRLFRHFMTLHVCVCVSESLGLLPPALLRHKCCLLMTTSSIGPEAGGVKAHQLSE